MGTISTGVGLISGINIDEYINALLAIEGRGRSRLETQVGSLQAQKTALLDVNARLLNFQNAAKAFRLDRIFSSVLATSSNAEVLSATASTGAQQGTYSFIVKQLVSTSQRITQGYADTDTSALGLDSLSFELGRGGLSDDVALEDLNGGTGIDRGYIRVVDSAGETGTIDLTDVTTLDEVVERINNSIDVDVTARIDGDGLVVTDNAAGAGTMAISNLGSDTTATDLGIAGSAIAGVITGTDINTIGGNTALSTLNDGLGVLILNNTPDFKIRAQDGTEYEIDLGQLRSDITTDTLLADLNNGDGVTIDDDTDTADLRFVDRTGTSHDVDLTGVTTVGGLIDRVNAETGSLVRVSLVDGNKLQVKDFTGGTGLLQVISAGDNGTQAAEDLGILNTTGVAANSFEGDVIPAELIDPAVTTIQGVIDRINNVEGNNGHIVASIGADGRSLQLVDTVGGGGILTTGVTTGNDQAVHDLGLYGNGVGNTLTGARVVSALSSVFVDTLNGGNGLNGATTISITDRGGAASLTLNTLDTYDSLSEIIDAINDEAQAQGVAVTASLNAQGNGLQITDTSGGTNNLVVTGDAATALGIEADVAENSVIGSSLQLQYVGMATRLEDLNYGRGISTGSFEITDGLGATATVNIGGTEKTVYDLLNEINSRGLAVTARINDNGDGIVIEEDAAKMGGQTAYVAIKVETVSGAAAEDLNIAGESEDIEGGYIDGSYEQVVDLDTTDSLEDVVEKINDAGIPVSASILNTGSGSLPYRLSLGSQVTGRAGELIIDTGGVDIGLQTLSKGEDAKVFFGSSNPADGFLITSSSNTIEDMLDGVTIDLVQASDDPVSLTVARDVDTIVGAMQQLVTTFNDVIGRINDYDSYDVDSEEKGVLLGNATTARVRSSLYRIVTGPAQNVSGPYKYLAQIGMGVNSEGQLTFDADRFKAAYADDAEGVASLMSAYDSETESTEQISEGISTNTSTTTYTSLGFAGLFENLAEQLLDPVNGVVTLADEAFDDQIALANQRIEDLDERLEARREQLLAEFIAMESALAGLQSQANALSQLTLYVNTSTTNNG
jgi:flagellar hook-associated protein 2